METRDIGKDKVLRQEAEKRLTGVVPSMPAELEPDLNAVASSTAKADKNPARLLHELQVRQLELEIQNEELQLANDELEFAKAEVEVGLQRYTSLYDFAPLAYFTLTRDGLITRTNLLGAALVQTCSSQKAAVRFMALVADNSLVAFNTFLHEVFQCHAKKTCEVHLRGHGSVDARFVELTGLADSDGASCNVALVDMTERQRAKLEIERLNKALELRVTQLAVSNSELEAFSYSVAHDLRTPLSAIDGFRSMLDRAIIENNTELAVHCCNRIHAGIEQMGMLTDGLLELARIARTELRCETVNLSEQAADVLYLHQEREPERSVVLHIQPNISVKGDPLLLQQVLVNLLGNAWKFTSKKPLGEISFGMDMDSNGEPVYFVYDNGAGFDMAYADRLFGAFERLHSLSEFPGTGIGLATVKRIIARHGGKIRAESAPGRGATFRFTLAPALP